MITDSMFFFEAFPKGFAKILKTFAKIRRGVSPPQTLRELQNAALRTSHQLSRCQVDFTLLLSILLLSILSLLLLSLLAL